MCETGHWLKKELYSSSDFRHSVLQFKFFNTLERCFISTDHICMTNTLKSLKFDLSPLFFQSTLLFLIVTYDTTNKIISFVYAFVDSDTANSWRWILEYFCCNMVIKKWEVYIILYSHIDNKLVVVKVFSNSWDDHNIVHILAMTSNFNTQFKGQHLENKFYIKCSGQFT